MYGVRVRVRVRVRGTCTPLLVARFNAAVLAMPRPASLSTSSACSERCHADCVLRSSLGEDSL